MGLEVVFFDLGDTLVTNANTKTWLPGAKALLASLNQQNFRLGIISNTTGLTSRQAILDILPSDFNISIFEPSLVIFSSEVGKSKPNRPIFEEATSRAGIGAGECLYCSENIVETLAAQSVGMLSVRLVAGSNDLFQLESNIDLFLGIP